MLPIWCMDAANEIESIQGEAYAPRIAVIIAKHYTAAENASLREIEIIIDREIDGRARDECFELIDTIRGMKPSDGWTCSRAPGHDGPCAAREATK